MQHLRQFIGRHEDAWKTLSSAGRSAARQAAQVAAKTLQGGHPEATATLCALARK